MVQIPSAHCGPLWAAQPMTPTLYDTCRIARSQHERRELEQEMYEYAIRIAPSFRGDDGGFALVNEHRAYP